jgi:hypothetical protein
MGKFVKWWRAKTPIYARFLQSLSVGVAAIPIYYETLPERFKMAIPDNTIMYISFFALGLTFLLNFLHVKEK